MRWLALVLVACALLFRPSGPLTVGGVAPGMTRSFVEASLGRPLSVGLTKSENLTELCLTVASYPEGLEVYYGPSGRVVNVRGRVLKTGERVVLRAGDDRAGVRALLGEPDAGDEVYADLEVYYRGAATVDYFELGSRV